MLLIFLLVPVNGFNHRIYQNGLAGLSISQQIVFYKFAIDQISKNQLKILRKFNVVSTKLVVRVLVKKNFSKDEKIIAGISFKLIRFLSTIYSKTSLRRWPTRRSPMVAPCTLHIKNYCKKKKLYNKLTI
ncbi:hypothetical protein BpHYR1_046274 [Brachionus plicatilis]|uniref:Uncharacterized protein n=1 Tax=Brachionus plicatilis TaxID=10195 RepID=A0A3M7PY36_BRAPC|nr:hypothetical protein BpHYR1_046274 [Brachionus plicatilis]